MIDITEEGVEAFKRFLDEHTCDRDLLKKTKALKSLGHHCDKLTMGDRVAVRKLKRIRKGW